MAKPTIDSMIGIAATLRRTMNDERRTTEDNSITRSPVHPLTRSLSEVPIQERPDRRVADQPVRQLDDPVPLVVEAQVLDHPAALLDRGHDLLGLADRHARVV